MCGWLPESSKSFLRALARKLGGLAETENLQLTSDFTVLSRGPRKTYEGSMNEVNAISEKPILGQ